MDHAKRVRLKRFARTVVCGPLARLLNARRRMTDGRVEWMAAAKCSERPQPGTTFSDLPRQDRREIVRVAVVSAAAAGYLMTLGIFGRPIPSRNLLRGADLPSAPVPRSELLEVRDTSSIELDPRPLGAQRTRARAGYEAAAVGTSAGAATRKAGKAAEKERRGNFFSRLFRGVARTIQPGVSKADTP